MYCMALRKNEISKLTKEEALKKLDELARSMLEIEPTSQKRASIKKSVARLKTYVHGLSKEKKEDKKTLKPALNVDKNAGNELDKKTR